MSARAPNAPRGAARADVAAAGSIRWRVASIFSRRATGASAATPAVARTAVNTPAGGTSGACGTRSRVAGGGPASDVATPPADFVIAALLVGLVAFGVVMVYSASSVFANQRYGNGHYFLYRQGAFALVGLGLAFAISRVDHAVWRRLTYPALGVSVLLLLVVALGLGRAANGAARWIQLGPINVQPSEVAKLAVILWLSHSLTKKRDRIRSFVDGFLPHVVVAGALMMLCLAQPDFGSAVMIAALTCVLLFTAGARTGYLVLAGALAVPVAWALVASSPYRLRRIQAFLEPFEHRYDIGYQVSESLMSFGAGGATGVGLGDSKQKLLYLPEAHTDFIGSIIGEELGFVGVTALVGCYVLLVVRGLRAAARAGDEYGTLLATGVSVFLALQALVNLSVAMGLLPTKGLVLPFISYGGSSLLVNCAALGLLLDVSRARPRGLADSTPADAPDAMARAATKARERAPTRLHGRRRARPEAGAPTVATAEGGIA